MASRYLVATGSFNSTSVWAATSGGVSGASVPTTADDVFLNAASGGVALTINITSSCQSFDCTGFTGTVTHAAAVTLSVGGNTAGTFKLVSGMTYTRGNTSTSALSFVSSVNGNTIACGGKTLGNVTFSGGGWTLQDTFTTDPASILTLTAGSVNSSGVTMSVGSFASSNSNIRTLTLGTSNVTTTSSGISTLWDMSTSTNLTLSAGTSTITFGSGLSSNNIRLGSLTYYNLVFSASGINNITGAATCNNFTRTVATFIITQLSIQDPLTINGTLTLTGTTATRQLVTSSSMGNAVMITAANVSLTNTSFRDIIAAGAAASFSGTALGDLYGNTNITFSTPVTYYWVGGSGNWEQSSHWATSSGGASGSGPPLPHDHVRFDTNSFPSAGASVNMNNLNRFPRSVDFTGVTNTPTIVASGNGGVYFYGSLTLVSGMTFNPAPNGISFLGRGTHTITSAGKTFGGSGGFSIDGNSYTLYDALISTVSLSVGSSSFNGNGFSITAPSLNASTTGSITLGPTLNLTGTSGPILSFGGSTTVNAGSTECIVAVASASTRTVSLNGKSISMLTYTVPSSAGILQIITSGTIGTLNVTGGRTLQLSTLVILSISQVFNVLGSPGNLVTINRLSGTTTISKSSGVVSISYASVTGITATGGATWYAYDSTNAGNNSGWIFAASYFGWGSPLA